MNHGKVTKLCSAIVLAISVGATDACVDYFPPTPQISNFFTQYAVKQQSVSFDGTDSYDNDEDGESISAYYWSFEGERVHSAGGTPSHQYSYAGLMNVRLIVRDNEGVYSEGAAYCEVIVSEVSVICNQIYETGVQYIPVDGLISLFANSNPTNGEASPYNMYYFPSGQPTWSVTDSPAGSSYGTYPWATEKCIGGGNDAFWLLCPDTPGKYTIHAQAGLFDTGDSIDVYAVEPVLKNGGTVVGQDGYVYIDDTPSMPQLSVSLQPGTPTGDAKWRLYIEYTRPDRGGYTGDRMYYPGPNASTWTTVSAASTWDITSEFGTDFCGGKAYLYCEYQGHSFDPVVFHIRGINPTEAAAKAYLDTSGPWYAYCIAKHESGTQSGRTYLQFNELGTLGPDTGDYKYCPNRGAGGDPYGWGMMQLDNIELPGQTSLRSPDDGEPWGQELWSWTANCDTAIQVMERKEEIGHSELRRIASDGAGGYIMPPDIIVSGLSFTSTGPHTPDELNTIKRYNGGNFWLSYDSFSQEWTHVPVGEPTLDYTEKVLNEYE